MGSARRKNVDNEKSLRGQLESLFPEDVNNFGFNLGGFYEMAPMRNGSCFLG